MRTLVAAMVTLGLLLAASSWAKKKKEDITQVLEMPKDPPMGVVADTGRLVFSTSPLTAKGLLSQQTREALKSLLKMNGGSAIVKIRAFVAGSGDMRRVPAIVSEMFTERHMALPAVSVVQSGGLPMEGAQVILESTAVSKRDVNPNGLLFVSGQAAETREPLQPTGPLAEQSLGELKTALTGAGSGAPDVLRVTCFATGLEDATRIRGMAASAFPQATLDIVQVQRAPRNSDVECEAVARLARPATHPIEFLNPSGLLKSPNHSQIVAVSAPRLVFTGTQVAFGFQESDARLAFQRLEKGLDQLGSSTKDVAMASIYPLSPSIAEQVRKIRFEFFDGAHPPASTLLSFEGLPSLDASFAIDVVAVVKR